MFNILLRLLCIRIQNYQRWVKVLVNILLDACLLLMRQILEYFNWYISGRKTNIQWYFCSLGVIILIDWKLWYDMSRSHVLKVNWCCSCSMTLRIFHCNCCLWSFENIYSFFKVPNINSLIFWINFVSNIHPSMNTNMARE